MGGQFYRIIPFLLLVFWSCTPTEEKFTVSSPQGEVTVDISAKKSSALDPYRVDIHAIGHEVETAVQVEVYVKEVVQGETVIFNWRDEHECVITFKEQDGTVRRFTLLFGDGEVIFAETA